MADRIIKDIRYYESDFENIDGSSLPQKLGRLFIPTADTNYIGQRIARKLNELKFCYNEFDHIYINFTTAIAENDFFVSNRNIDKTIKYVDFGLSPTNYNSLSNIEKDKLLKSITFRILKHISSLDNLKLVEDVELLIEKLDTEVEINYKIKETSNYKVEISYQIKPLGSTTRAIVTYLDKKNNEGSIGFIPLQFYDDIYWLLDSITLKGDELIFNQKKSPMAEIHNEKYKTPVILKLSELEKFNS